MNGLPGVGGVGSGQGTSPLTTTNGSHSTIQQAQDSPTQLQQPGAVARADLSSVGSGALGNTTEALNAAQRSTSGIGEQSE